jgi:hypothetical protein
MLPKKIERKVKIEAADDQVLFLAAKIELKISYMLKCKATGIIFNKMI